MERRGELGDVYALTKVDNQHLADRYSTPIGGLLISIEFVDGESLTLSEAWVKKVPKDSQF